jgi:hypothetical protein
MKPDEKNIGEAYQLADKIYAKHICHLPTINALEIIQLNLDVAESEFLKFTWEVIYQKVKARDRRS